MPNEVLWPVLMLASFAGILLAYRLFGVLGLYAWTALAVIVANVQVLKVIQIFSLETAMGNIVYGTTFLVTDILAEVHGEKAARRAVFLGFFVLVATTILVQLCLWFAPSPNDRLSPHLEAVFGFFPRIVFASVTAYLLSQLFDVWLFQRLRRATSGRRLWLRNNLSTMVSQLVDNSVFTWIAFVGFGGLLGMGREYPWPTIVSIFFTSYAMKWIVAACDTPFLYAARRFGRAEPLAA
jgi:uncharacterized integral membrane protein (TIGR00697 family)